MTRLSRRLYFLQSVTSAGGACARARAAKPGIRDQGRPASAASARLQGRSVELWSQQGGSVSCRRAKEHELRILHTCWHAGHSMALPAGGFISHARRPRIGATGSWGRHIKFSPDQLQTTGRGLRAENSGMQADFPESQLSLAQPAPVAVSRASSAVPLSWAVTPAPSQLLAQLPLYMSPGREAGALCLPWLPHVCSAEELGAWCSPPAVRRGPVGLGADGRGPCSHPGPTWQSPHSPIAQGPESLCFLPGPRRKPKSPWALGRPGAAGVLGKPPWGKAHPVFLLCSAHAAACSPA